MIPDTEDIIDVPPPVGGRQLPLTAEFEEESVLNTCHKEVGKGRSALGAHRHALALSVEQVVELEDIILEDHQQ